MLIREQNLFEQAEKPICNYFNQPRFSEIINEQYRFIESCKRICPRNCLESIYTYTVDHRKGGNYHKASSSFSINIAHNNLQDQLIEYKPNLSWIALIFNAGGTFGILMGFTIIFFLNLGI